MECARLVSHAVRRARTASCAVVTRSQLVSRSSAIARPSTPRRFLDGDVKTTDPQMLFEAGRVAAQRGWSSPQVVDVASVLDQGPSGPPLIIFASPDELTPETARTIAALLGAGRDAVILSAGVAVEAVAGWLPAGSIICVDDTNRDPGDAGDALEPSRTQPYCELRHEPPQWSQNPDGCVRRPTSGTHSERTALSGCRRVGRVGRSLNGSPISPSTRSDGPSVHPSGFGDWTLRRRGVCGGQDEVCAR